ncbi:MAG: DUF4340 domain-containing protein [Planctomycetota bacterium]
MNKTIITLITVSILLFFVYLIANYYSEYKKVAYKPDYVPLKFKLNSDTIDRIVLERGNKQSTIVKIKKKWIVESFRYPADVSKIHSLINRLNEIKEGKIVSIDPTQFDIYGVGPQTGIKTVFYHNNNEVLSVIIGKNTENNRDGSFIRFPADNKVFNVAPLLENEVSVENRFWLKKELKILEKDNINKIIIKGDSNYTFLKSAKKWWIKVPKLAPASDIKIKEIIDRFAYLNIDDIERTKNKKECETTKPKYTVTVKYTAKIENKNIKKKYILTIGKEVDRSKEKYYATLRSKNLCFIISSSYVEPLRLAHFEVIERELIPSDLFTHEVASLEFTNFIPAKLSFIKKKVGKDNYKWLSKYRGKYKYFNYEKIRNLFELLKSVKVEDYERDHPPVKFNRSFVVKTETKDVYDYSIFYEKDKKECAGHTSRFPRLYEKLLCSDIEQIEDNIRKLLKVK